MLSPLEPRQTYLTGTGPETGTDSSSPNSDPYSAAKIGIAVGGGVVGFLVLVGILSAIVCSGNRRRPGNPQMYAPGPGGAALPLPRPRPLARTRTLDGISLANIPARAPPPHVSGAALAAIGQPLDSFNATDSAPMPGPRSVNDSEVSPLAADSDPPPYSDSRPTEII